MDIFKVSLYALLGTTILCILFLYVWKPKFVTNQKKKILWGKLISISLVLGILVGILLFMWKPKGYAEHTLEHTPGPKKEKVQLAFSNSY